MEIFELKNDINLICNTATSFPNKVQEAFDGLAAALPHADKRTAYGLSRPDEKGKIIYKAAMNELVDGEAKDTDFEAFTVGIGTYRTETIMNWRDNMKAFEETFGRLLDSPDLDYNSPCIEWYKSDKEVMCMVKITKK